MQCMPKCVLKELDRILAQFNLGKKSKASTIFTNQNDVDVLESAERHTKDNLKSFNLTAALNL